ncbi:hypothetical protein ACLBQR_31825, partial [Klebsiella pneumoniae]
NLASRRTLFSLIIDNVKSTFNSATTKVTNWMENTSARVSQVIGRAQEGITDTYYTAKYKLRSPFCFYAPSVVMFL